MTGQKGVSQGRGQFGGVNTSDNQKIWPEIMAEFFPESTDSRRFWSFPQGIGKKEEGEHEVSQRAQVKDANSQAGYKFQ